MLEGYSNQCILVSYEAEVKQTQPIDFQKGYDICMENVTRLAENAELLAQKHSFGHAFFLYFTAMEKAVKAYYYALVHIRLLRYDDKVRKDLMDHESKTAFFYGVLLSQTMKSHKRDIPNEKPSKEAFVESIIRLAEVIKDFAILRQSCLYVDLVNHKWASPSDFAESDFVLARESVRNFISFVKDTASVLLKMPEEKLEEFFSQFTPPFAEATLLVVRGMSKDGFLAREQGEKEIAFLTHQIEKMTKQRRGYRAFWKEFFGR